MKKSILTIVTIVMLSLTNLFANSTEVNSKVLREFEKEYATAKDASWEINRNYVKVTFVNVDQVISVYYGTDGTKLATSRNILSNQLPIKLQVELKKLQQKSWISDLFEFYSENESGYYVTIENGDEKMVYRSLEGGEWEVYSRERK